MLISGLRLLGVFFLVTTLGALAYLPNHATFYDRDSQSMILAESWELLVAAILAGLLVLKALPAWLLIRYAPAIASRFESDNEAPREPTLGADAYPPLAALLALFFLVTGAGLFLTGGVQLVSDIVDESPLDKSWSLIRYSIGSTIDGAVRLIAAALIYYHALGRSKLRRESSAV